MQPFRWKFDTVSLETTSPKASLAEKLKENMSVKLQYIGNRGEFSIWIYRKKSDNKEGFFIVGKEGFDFPLMTRVIALTDKIIEQII